MASKGNKVYFFGGLKDKTGSTDSVEEFDLETGKWEGKEDLPGAMNRMSAVTSQDGFIYVIGGENEEGDTVNSVYKYDPSTDKYIEISPLKYARKNFAQFP
jgi:N-acetylneuraminic acid mutarotase